MARQPKVTRTITATVCKVLCVNTEKKNTESIEVTIPRTYDNEKAMLKAVEKTGLDPFMKPVTIEESKVIETLYGMSEQDFIAHATVLPPRDGTEDKPNK